MEGEILKTLREIRDTLYVIEKNIKNIERINVPVLPLCEKQANENLENRGFKFPTD